MKNSATLKFLFFVSIILSVIFTACNVTPDSTDGSKETGKVDINGRYLGPTYVDNYAGISSWANKDQWNLSNTHDPTVFKWTDGYWYMFGTDASYGNAHDSATTGKHFQGKRSTDLVNWEWVPGVMDGVPDWLVTKLNEYREAQNLDPIAKADISAGYWAPCARVITVDGVTKVRMYYDIVVDNYIGNGKTATKENFDNTWSERAFIGVMETTNPNGGPSAWTDLGYVLCSSSDRGPDGYARTSLSNWDAYFYFNAIDPTYFIDDDDSHWMIYGSWHSGFAIVRINPATGKVAAVDGDDYLTGNVTGDFKMGYPWSPNGTKSSPKPEELISQGYGTRVFSRGTSRWQPAEGPELVKKDGYYWLFFANDGLDVPYQTRVVRATSIQGPYYAIDGSKITNDVDGKRNGSTNIYPIVTHPYKFSDEEPASGGYGSCYGWVGISHCAVFNNGDDWYYMSQQRLPANVANNAYSNAIMMGGVRQILWTPSTANGTELWPMVLPERYGAIPESYAGAIKESEIPGEWQHIDLAYNYEKMDVATELILGSDHAMSGALNGSWSFNKEKQQLTLTPSSGTEVTVGVAREIDWEKVPRYSTIVYTGTQKNLNKTYWGKQETQFGDNSYSFSYADSYANATLMSTYTMTIADTAKDDLAWYLYPQWGTWSYVVDEGDGEESDVASVTGFGDWWKGSDSNKGTKHIVEDGKTLTFYLWTSDATCTMILEGYSSSAATYADINYHDTNPGWGDAVSAWGSSDSRTAIDPNAAQSVKIEITRSGNTQVAKIYQK